MLVIICKWKKKKLLLNFQFVNLFFINKGTKGPCGILIFPLESIQIVTTLFVAQTL